MKPTFTLAVQKSGSGLESVSDRTKALKSLNQFLSILLRSRTKGSSDFQNKVVIKLLSSHFVCRVEKFPSDHFSLYP